MSEVEKTKQYCIDNDVEILGITTAYELGLTDAPPTNEQIASEINRVNKWLEDPVNNLTSSLRGAVMIKEDTIMCLETRQGLQEDGTYGSIPMTKIEEREVRQLKEDCDLFKKAVSMIEGLSSNE